MNWNIIKEEQRKFADESYYLKAERNCPEGKLVLEICWAQFMYNITVDLFQGVENKKHMFGCMVFCDDRIEKYGHQILRMTNVSPMNKLERLDSMQKDGVLNYNISEKYNVAFKSDLPQKA